VLPAVLKRCGPKGRMPDALGASVYSGPQTRFELKRSVRSTVRMDTSIGGDMLTEAASKSRARVLHVRLWVVQLVDGMVSCAVRSVAQFQRLSCDGAVRLTMATAS
jgi:hypothetical protein